MGLIRDSVSASCHDGKEKRGERTSIESASSLEELEDFLGGDGPLELLSVQEVFLELWERLAGLDERFCALAVSSSEGS
jgi:hypothetical protein